MIKIKKFILGSIVFVIAVVGGNILKEVVTEASPGDLTQQITKLANKYNKSLPMMIDKETELVSTGGINNFFRYSFRLVNVLASQLDAKQFQLEQRPQIQSYYCSSKDFAELRKMGLAVQYVYMDKEYKEIVKIVVENGDCG